MNPIALPELLKQLRNDLLEAQRDGGKQAIKFLIEDVEVELQVTATREDTGSLGVKFWVLDATGEMKDADARTQKLRLRMKAIGPDKESAAISGHRKSAP